MQPTPRDDAWSIILEDLCRIIDGRLQVRRGGFVQRGPFRELWCECTVIRSGRRWTQSPPTAEGIWRAWTEIPRGVGNLPQEAQRRSLKLAMAQMVQDLAAMTGLGFRVLADRVLCAGVKTQEVVDSCEGSS